jgi:capsular exopolysaccharide synthesis family protein
MKMSVENKSIYLNDLLGELLKKWWILLLAFILFAVASYYFTIYMITPIYRASATIFIGTDGRPLAGLTIADITLGQRLTADYRELIRTDRLIGEVLSKLPAEHRNVHISANLLVHVVPDSRFMRIFFNDPNPERAALVLNALSEVLIEQAENIVGVRNVQIVDYAQTPRFPVSPNLFNNVIVAGLLGLILAVLLILFKLFYSDAIKRREDIEQELGLNVLTVVPKVKEVDKNNTYNGLVTIYKPNSLTAESYRIFRTNLSFLNIDREVKIIAFTSASPEEGKTSSIANFAVTLGSARKKVLLVDCDLRKGRIHNIFNLNQTPGLTNYLAQKVDYNEAYNRMAKYESLHVLTSGVLPPNPVEILSSTAFEKFILEVREQYDYILIDTPPVLSVAETAVICKFADGVVLVATANGTQKGELKQAQGTLQKIGAHIFGVLLRNATTSNKHRYYAYNSTN